MESRCKQPAPALAFGPESYRSAPGRSPCPAPRRGGVIGPTGEHRHPSPPAGFTPGSTRCRPLSATKSRAAAPAPRAHGVGRGSQQRQHGSTELPAPCHHATSPSPTDVNAVPDGHHDGGSEPSGPSACHAASPTPAPTPGPARGPGSGRLNSRNGDGSTSTRERASAGQQPGRGCAQGPGAAGSRLGHGGLREPPSARRLTPPPCAPWQSGAKSAAVWGVARAPSPGWFNCGSRR